MSGQPPQNGNPRPPTSGSQPPQNGHPQQQRMNPGPQASYRPGGPNSSGPHPPAGFRGPGPQPGRPPVMGYPRPPPGARPSPPASNQMPGGVRPLMPPQHRPPPGQYQVRPNQPHPQGFSQPPGQRPHQPMSPPQGIDQVTNQLGGMDLNSQAQQEMNRPKVKSRYANDPSLSSSGDVGMNPPQYQPNNQPPQPQPQSIPSHHQGQPPMPPQMSNMMAQPQQGFAQKPRIDPNQAPSAVEVQRLDQSEFGDEPFYTLNRSLVPRASTDYCGVDNGNANPRFMRLTTGNIPVSSELHEAVQIPLALVVQPLAQLREDEMPVPEVDFGPDGPLRCTRCKGYINPFVSFINGGRRYICNLCRFENDVPDTYFCNLDMNGRRLDVDQRPELKLGSVEFVATKEFCNRPPAPASIVFALDVSWSAVQCGALHQSVFAIKNYLFGPQAGLTPNIRVGLITFDRNVHFYNFNASLEQAQMLVVSDSNDPFVPLSDGFLVDPNDSRHVIEPLLDTLITMYGNNRISEAAFGAAITCAQLALESTGGKVFAFQSSMPTSGLGGLKSRDNLKAFGSEKERALFIASDPFYEKLGQSCLESGVSVDLFVSSTTYVDIASIGTVASLTNGEVFLYPGFDAKKHGYKMVDDVCKAASRPFGTSAVMRVRCSDGLQIDRHLGNFFMRNSADVELAAIDSNKSIAVILQHEGGKLDEKLDVSFQVALLYTRSTGERRIRVHNLSVPVTTLAGNVFKFSDMDCIVNVLGRLASKASLETPLKSVRDNITEKCVSILTSYRKNCAQGTSPGQLILPETLKLFPLLANSLLKNKAFRSGMDVSLDVKVQNLINWLSMPIPQSIPLLYPRLAAIHTLAPEVGKPGSNGRIVMPEFVRASYPFLEPEGAYLLENGQQMFMWLGRKVDPALINALFGVGSIDQIDSNLTDLPSTNNPFSDQVLSLIHHLRVNRSHAMPLQIIRQQLDPAEVEFCNLLVEDKNVDNPSYVDYLCLVHRQIQTEKPSAPPQPQMRFL